MSVIAITDILSTPLNEGGKIAVYNILNELKKDRDSALFSINSDPCLDLFDYSEKLNKLLIGWSFYRKVRRLCPENILYIPESSNTLASIIRAWLLRVFTGKRVSVLALQPRRYYGFKRFLVRMLSPVKIITTSTSYAEYLQGVGVNCVSIPLGVNDEIYRQYDEEKKIRNRRKYNISPGKIVLLHVGHICGSRNLEWLLEVKKRRPEIEVLIVGSTYNESDSELHLKLEAGNIRVINQHIENMVELYNLADYYLFPVIDDQGAISTPLSVLEAMSCNVSIITTRFGSLIDMFSADSDFHYVDDSAGILRVLQEKHNLQSECTNRQKIECYTWEKIANRIEQAVG